MATSSGGCRQTLIPHQTTSFVGADCSLPVRPASAFRLDSACRQLRTALLFLSLPLASAARTFCGSDGWKELGYARLSDHALERLGRSARWVRDLAALSEAMERLPGLGSALTGEDGGRPIGLVAAHHIGKVASRESLTTWLSIARTDSVRTLKARVSHAVKAGSPWPEAEPSTSGPDLQAESDSQQHVRLLLPAAVREAFAEALDLYRAVEGHAACVGEFVDSLMAEAGSGLPAGEGVLEKLDGQRPGFPLDETSAKRVGGIDGTTSRRRRRMTPRAELKPFPRVPADRLGQEAMFRSRARRWLRETLDHVPEKNGDKNSWPMAATDSRHLVGLSAAVIADARMRRLLFLHDELERQLAEVVTQLADAGAWRALGYTGFGDYARRGLGWSRSTLNNRVQLVRRLRRLPVVRQAYQQGRIGQVAARTIARVLTRENSDGTTPLGIPDETQRAWVKRATVATIKRLQDETRAVSRLMVMGQGDREPLDDRTWHASLHRQVGTARQRVHVLARMAMAAPGPLLPLRLTLKCETAADLCRVLAVARKNPALMQTFSMFQKGRSSGPPGDAPGWVGVETFSVAGDSVPVWVALLALLQDFIETWDVDAAGRRSSAQRIYGRDGWRCMAPGCSSRRNLEVHHVVYRSQGGNDQPGNLLCLCRFHHQMGEHGLLMKVRGEAPLGLRWWLGRNGSGGSYRNEIRQSWR